MEFPEKDIFIELITRLKTYDFYFVDRGHVAPAHYDWDHKQYTDEVEPNTYPFNRPGIFIEFDLMPYEPRGGFDKRGTIPLIVTVVQDKYVDSMDTSINQADFTKLLE